MIIKYTIQFLSILLLATLMACGGNSGSGDSTSGNNQDSVDLTLRLRDAYKWAESRPKKDDFPLKTNTPSDTVYAGLDWDAHNAHVKLLEGSGFFAKSFMDEYAAIAQKIDNIVKSGKTAWIVGEMPPYGGEADLWCNCQDRPDNYADLLSIQDLQIQNNEATFSFSWSPDSKYQAKAMKDAGVWKISFLQEFDSKKVKE